MTDKMEVIGLLTFGGDRVGGQEISGFDFVVPSSTVMEFIKAAGVANEMGHADRAYREGLELYWDERYSSAIPKFEEVKRLFPEHSEVNRLIQGSQQAIAEGKDKSTFPSWTIIAIVLVVLFLIVAIIVIGAVVFFIMRKRNKGKAAKGGPGTRSTGPGPRPSSSPSGPRPLVVHDAPTPSPSAPHETNPSCRRVHLRLRRPVPPR